MNVFIVSDHHFFDTYAMILSGRDYENSLNGMVQNGIDMFNLHNQTVDKDDLVIFLGDVARLNSQTKKIFKEMLPQMKGHKILIKGNHDKKSDQYYLDAGFEGVTDYLVIGRFFLCHYPLNEIHSAHEKLLLKICKKHKCDTIIHGHVHTEDVQNLSDKDYTRINVCVDYSEMIPTKFSEHIFKTFGRNFLKKVKSGYSLPQSYHFFEENKQALEEKKKGNYTKQFREEYTITKERRKKTETFRRVA
jgi:calcineurin-like phosphoesterase family protein